MPTLAAVPRDRTRGSTTVTSHNTPDNTTHVPHTQDNAPNTGDVTNRQTPAIVRPLASTTRPGGNMTHDSDTTSTTNGGEGGEGGTTASITRLATVSRRLNLHEALGNIGTRLADPNENYAAIADGAGLDLVEHLVEHLDRVTAALSHRDECAALAADGHPTPPTPPGVATGTALDELLQRAEAAALLGCCRADAA